ncbi:MAG: TetR/AcrR family transcriptional regulator [Nitrospirota bacterium]
MGARGHSATKEKLLDAAQRLMLAKGYEATTVDDICQAAGLTKGSFFHYFDNKEALGKAALTRFVCKQAEAFGGAPFLKKRDPLQRVYGFVDCAIQMACHPDSPASCLVGTLAQELSATHPEIRALCAELFARSSEGFTRDLEAAKARHAPGAKFDPAGVAEHFVAVIQGALILAKAKQDREVIARHLRHYKQYLKTLFESESARR